MRTKLLKVIALLVMISLTATTVGAQPQAARVSDATAPANGSALSQDPKQPEFESAEATLVKTGGRFAAYEPTVYIIQFSEPSLAAYGGGIAGLQGTSPKVTGATQLDPTSPASVAYLNYLEAQHNAFVAGMERAFGRSVEVLFRYDAVLNGIAARLSAEEAAAVTAMSGVKRVERDFERQIATDTGPTWIGAPGIWDGSATGVPTMGEGTVIGVLDTGINGDHPSFAAVGPSDGYVHVNPLGPGVFLGNCAPPTPTYTCNDKLIGVYDFAGDGPEDNDGHGSHTASTSAGNFLDDIVIAFPTTTITESISGVAPHANIIAYDVCLGGSCPNSATNAGINQAVLDGVDAINYSIGGGPADPWQDSNSQAYLDARAAGVFVATSASNDGPAPGTVGSPANAPWLLSVGNATHSRTYTSTLSYSGGDTALGDMIGTGVTGAYGPAPIVHAGDYGDPLCGTAFAAATWTGGEIVVCDRGGYALVDKVSNVQAGGAGGAVIANAAANGYQTYAIAHVLPTVHVNYDNAELLRAWLGVGSGHTATNAESVVAIDDAFGDRMAVSSGRGPNLPVPDVIKPNVITPGSDILAASLNGEEFALKGGTSMASPHAAGAALLMRALYPGWTEAQIQSALMSSAMYGDAVKEDWATPADPFDMGAGRIYVGAAAQAGLVLDEVRANFEAADPSIGGDPSTLNLAQFAQDQCLESCTWTRELESTLGYTLTWQASVMEAPSMTLTVDPISFTLPAGGTQIITVEADVAALPVDAWAFGGVKLTPASDEVTFEFSPEDFEGGVMPFGWTTETLAVWPGWWRVDTPANHSTSFWSIPDNGSTYVAAANDDATPASDGSMDYLVTPELDLSAGSAYTLTFDSYFNGSWGQLGYVEVTTDGVNWTTVLAMTGIGAWTPIQVDLSAYAGESAVWVGFHSDDDGAWAGGWAIDNVSVDPPVQARVGTAMPSAAHFPVAVQPTSGVLPGLVEVNTRRDVGSQLIPDLEAKEITELTVESFGLVPMTEHDFALDQVPDNTMDFPDIFFQDGAHATELDVPAGSPRLVVEVLETTSPDLDMLVLFDANGNGVPELTDVNGEECQSAAGGPYEFCDIANPSVGTWFAIVINYTESDNPPDPVTLGTAIVPGTDVGNLTFQGPTSVPKATPFDLRVYWDEPALEAGGRWYGAFSMGSAPASVGDIGTIPVNVMRYEDSVSKTADVSAAWPGDTVEFSIAVQPNVTPEDLTYTITDTIPAGFTYVPGSATGGAVVSDGVLTWTGTMPTLVGVTGDYVVSTNATDPMCDTGFGGYVNLEGYGILAQAGITGDTTAWTAFAGDPINFYGEQYPAMSFVDDGFAIFDVDTNWAGSPWTAQTVPDADPPNNLAAMYWHDFEVFYDGALNHGVSLATNGPNMIIVEYDDIQLFGGSAPVMDFEIVMTRAVDDTPGFYEIVYAYDNVNATPGPATVGVEDVASRAAGQALVNNADPTGVIVDGLQVCFDYVGPSLDPVLITYQATVDASLPAGTVLTNAVEHAVDNPGSDVDATSTDVAVRGPEPTWEKEVWISGEMITGTVYSGIMMTDTVTIVDRVSIDSRYNVTFTLTEDWSESLVFEGYELPPGSATMPGMDVDVGTGMLTWTVTDMSSSYDYIITKTFSMADGFWVLDTVRESLNVEGAATQPDDVTVELWHAGYNLFVPVFFKGF